MQIVGRSANWVAEMPIASRPENRDTEMQIGLREIQIGLRKCKLDYVMQIAL